MWINNEIKTTLLLFRPDNWLDLKGHYNKLSKLVEVLLFTFRMRVRFPPSPHTDIIEFMKYLSKLLFIIFLLLSIFSGHLFHRVKTVSAELEPPSGKVEDPDPFPKLKYPCDADGLDPEFHSLRPYQAAPCGGAPLARFCSNELVFIETFDLARKGDCRPKRKTGSFTCNPQFHVEPHDLYIELSGSELPILGNTEQVTNSQGGTEVFNDAQKLNEYASWYLSGVNGRAEYGEVTSDQVVNFSGPLNKLIPLMIAESERKNTIEKASEVIEFTDDTGTSDDGKATQEKTVENHDQIVVCADKNILGVFGYVSAKPCPDGDKYRLKDWLKDLSLARSLGNTINNIPNGILGGLLGGFITQELNSAGVGINLDDAWNKRYPPLPWADENGKPFESRIEYEKAYSEWKGKSCFIVIGRLFCIDNPLVTNEYADLYSYVPLSSTADKKGANYIMGDGPSYTGGAGTKVENGQHTSFSGAPLYFAHTQEVKELSSLLNQTYQPEGFEEVEMGYSKDVEVIKKGSKPALSPLPSTSSPDKQNPTYPGDPYAGMDCSAAQIRINQGDNLFAGDKGGQYEMWVRDVEYDITEVECDEVYEWVEGCKGSEEQGNLECGYWESSFKCPAYVELSIKTAVKVPNVDDIFKQTVAGTGSTFRKIFPKVGEGTPVECIADIPTSTDVYYDPTQSESPQGPSSDISFKVRQNPDDGANSQDQLTFPHIGSVYEYFLKGIQTALRPKGYGEPIANGNCKPKETTDCSTIWEERLEKSSGGDCGICSSELGDLAKRILATAGKAYNVPAASIWAAMKHEGGDWDEFRGQFTDENVRKWSTPIECGGEPMPSCDPTDQTGSRAYPPFGFLPYWFYRGSGSGALWTAVQVFEPTRNSIDTVSHCNFLDAAFASAKSLATWSAFSRLPTTCYGKNMTNTSVPSCSGWTDDIVVQSHLGYWIGITTWCPDGTGGGSPLSNNIPIPEYANRVISDFNSAKCN